MQSITTSQNVPFYPVAAERLSTSAPGSAPAPLATSMPAGWQELLPGKAWLARQAADIPAHYWGQGIAGECFDARYYQIVEQTLQQGFHYRYAILHNREKQAWAVQPYFLVDQDLAMGLPQAGQTLLGRVRHYFPRFLRSTMLMVGCAAGEGALDSREPWAIALLHETLEAAAKEAGASLLLLKDFPAATRDALSPFQKWGYQRVPSMPGAQLSLEDGDFETYMQRRLSRVYRKGLRRKFRECERLGGVAMEEVRDAASLSAIIDELYPLYRQTFERSKLHFEELTPEYFCQLAEKMGDRLRLFVWRYQGRAVAFSLCMVHGEVLYDMNIGLDYNVALHLHLYFITWRDIVSWAMERGLKSYYTGPLNYDPKLHFRLRLAPLDLYVRHRSRWLNPLFGKLLAYLHPTRYEAVLRRFPNADELW